MIDGHVSQYWMGVVVLWFYVTPTKDWKTPLTELKHPGL